MNSDTFIDHPYLAIVIAIVISLVGALAIFALPVAQYPNVTPPQVSITTTYPGASAQELLDSVIEPIETQVNGVRDLIYLSSTGSNSGSVSITATFRIGSDGRANTQDTQDRVNWALPQLPETVQREGVIVQEQSGNILMAMTLYSPNRSYDTLFLSNYATIQLKNRLSRIPGVANIQIFGGSDYAMRFWLDTDKLAAMNLPVSEVVRAVQNQNLLVSSGAVGAAPNLPGEPLKYTVRTRGRLTDPAQFRDIVVRSTPGGPQVRLGDVARIELGGESYSTAASLNNQPAVMLLVYQQSDANGIAISDACRAAIAELSQSFPPDLACGFQYDSTEFIRTSVRDVAVTLATAVALVALVTLLFLQNWRMALVPTLAIPVSILGAFAGLRLLGYSINMVTLFGLVLAIGIVVDDAIIVIENVHRLMVEEKLAPREAASRSMRQITGAIIATTLVLLAMFVPICFLSGITGELYRQFGVTISTAVLLSAVNALTLSPALAALLLKPDMVESRFFLFRWFNAGFGAISKRYGGGVAAAVRRVLPVLAVYLVLTGAAVWTFHRVPGGFIPEEDQGVFFAGIRLPPGSSLERTEEKVAELSAIFKKLPGVRDVLAAPGFNILNRTPAANNAFLVVVLEPWDRRLKRGLSAAKLVREAERASFLVPEAFTMVFEPPPIPGIGTAGGFNFVLENTAGSDPDALGAALDAMLEEVMANPKFTNVFTTFNLNCPYLKLEIDREKALRLGVDLQSIYSTLEGTLGVNYINDFNRFGQVYKVELQAEPGARDTMEKIRRLHVPGSGNTMVPLDSLIRLSLHTAPEFLSRYNLFLSAELQGSPAPGVSSGEALSELEAIAARTLPPGIDHAWTDMSYQQKLAGNQALPVFALALLFIYLFLAALYESWVLPFSVILAVFPSLLGAAALLTLTGIADNIYTQIGVVLLFAMSCKSSILIVDFALQRSREGADASAAAVEAAKLRFRAIVMTGAAFVLGTLPLLYASGPGAASQRSIGAAVVGGMTCAVLFGVFLVPVFYRICRKGAGG